LPADRDEAGNPLFRRADLRARSAFDRRGAARHPLSCRRAHDDGHRDARDALCPRRERPRRVSGRQQIRDSLPDEIVLDLRYNSAYWAQYKGLTATVTQSLNDKMIKSYGDELGTQSYGAVVDLLVNYYA